MAQIVIMPRQGQSVESCVITEWKKKVGDPVAEKEVLFSYETDKSTFDEPSPANGVLLAVFAEEGDDVECLRPVCIVGQQGEDISSLIPAAEDTGASAPAQPTKETAEKDNEAAAEAPSAESFQAPTGNAGGKMKISPRARRLAEKTDADLSRAVPTGPNGRIIERDVNALLDKGFTLPSREEAAPEAPVPSTAPKAEEYDDVKLSGVRRTIARSMHASLSEMAQLTLHSSFDATQVMAYRARLKEKSEALGMNRITLNDMILYAVSRTLLPGHKALNAHYLEEPGVLRCFSSVHLGVAVDTERGLLVPTVREADKLSLSALAAASHEAIDAAQKGSISPDKLKGASFTVTNLGSLGIESFTPVINPPQTAILGVGSVVFRLRENGQTYRAMGLSLTFDHRALDGAPAARFLKELCAALADFDLLLAK